MCASVSNKERGGDTGALWAQGKKQSMGVAGVGAGAGAGVGVERGRRSAAAEEGVMAQGRVPGGAISGRVASPAQLQRRVVWVFITRLLWSSAPRKLPRPVGGLLSPGRVADGGRSAPGDGYSRERRGRDEAMEREWKVEFRRKKNERKEKKS